MKNVHISLCILQDVPSLAPEDSEELHKVVNLVQNQAKKPCDTQVADLIKSFSSVLFDDKYIVVAEQQASAGIGMKPARIEEAFFAKVQSNKTTDMLI